HRPVRMLDDGRAAFHPVAGVDVGEAVEIALRRVVDMAADDAVDALAFRLGGQRFLEAADEIDGVLDLELRPGGEGPVGQAEPAADAIDPRGQGERNLVGPVAEEGEPSGVAHHHVEDVAVNDEIAPAVGRLVDRRFADLDAAEMRTVEIAQELVMVAGDVDHPGALARLAQDLLDHVVVRLRPIPAIAQPPAVDDVSDQVDGVGVVFPQELEKRIGLRSPGAEMHVRNEEAAIAPGNLLDGRIGVMGPFHARISAITDYTRMTHASKIAHPHQYLTWAQSPAASAQERSSRMTEPAERV